MAVEEVPNAEAPAPVDAEALPVVETPEVPAVELHTDTPSALSGASAQPVEIVAEPDVPAEEKPVETPEAEKPAEEAKPEEKKPDDKPADEKKVEPEEKPVEPEAVEPIKYTEFTFPEGITADPEKVGKVTEIIGKYQLPQEAAQGLIDLHTETLKAFADQTYANQHKVFADTRKAWVNEAKADEEIGGAAWDTSLGKIARMRDMFVPASETKAFNEFLDLTGAGDHPLFLKMMNRIAHKFDEPSTAIQGKPPKDIGKAPGKRGMAALYDNPASSHNK